MSAPEHRPTPTQAFRELAMAHAQRPARTRDCNVDLTLNAKGDVQIGVSAQGPADELAAVGKAVEAEFDRLCAKYPRPEPTDADEALKQARKAAAIQAARAKANAT
jgi:hypothetical protein